MTLIRIGLFLTLCTPGLLLADESDAVNERIHVPRADMEAQWGTDCIATWREVSRALDSNSSDNCAVLPGLQKQLQLCAFIYQPPGEVAHSTCPDYSRAYRASQTPDCAALTESIEISKTCEGQ